MARNRKEKNPKAVGFGRMMAWQLREVSSGIALMAIGYITRSEVLGQRCRLEPPDAVPDDTYDHHRPSAFPVYP